MGTGKEEGHQPEPFVRWHAIHIMPQRIHRDRLRTLRRPAHGLDHVDSLHFHAVQRLGVVVHLSHRRVLELWSGETPHEALLQIQSHGAQRHVMHRQRYLGHENL